MTQRPPQKLVVSNYVFTPKIGEMIQFDEHIFSSGLDHNHQLEEFPNGNLWNLDGLKKKRIPKSWPGNQFNAQGICLKTNLANRRRFRTTELRPCIGVITPI